MMAIMNCVMLSELEFNNRIDGELYNPRLMVSYSELIKSDFPLKKLKYCCQIYSGTTPPDRDDSLKDGPILFKTTDIRNNVLDPANDYYHISMNIHDRMSRTKLKNNDVLLNIVGATLEVIGRVGYIADFFNDVNITQAMVFLRIIDDGIKPGYLFIFLCTKYAQDQIKRFARPTGQYNLNLPEVGNITIPVISEKDQAWIQQQVSEAGNILKTSSELYNKARKIFIGELAVCRRASRDGESGDKLLRWLENLRNPITKTYSSRPSFWKKLCHPIIWHVLWSM